MAQALLSRRWCVSVLDRDREAVRDLAAEGPSANLIVIRADVAKGRGVTGAFEKIAAWITDGGDTVSAFPQKSSGVDYIFICLSDGKRARHAWK